MGEDWIKYQCKSGQTLFTYNKETGEHHWPLGLPEGIEYRIICSRSVDHKQVSTIATQTDDNGCNNRCTSECVNTNTRDISNTSYATHPQQQLDISDDRSNMICEMQAIKLEPRDEQEEGQSSRTTAVKQETKSIADNIHENYHSKNSLRETDDQAHNISEMFQNPEETKFSAEVEMIDNRREGYESGDDARDVDSMCDAGTSNDYDSIRHFDNDDDDDNDLSNNDDDHGVDINATSGVDEHVIDDIDHSECKDSMIKLDDATTLRVVHKQYRDVKVILIPEENEFLPEIFHNKSDHVVDQNADLHVDVSRSTETTNYECSVCKKVFKNKYLLQRHSVVHTGEKKFQCSICKKTFSQKCYLITHYRTHTGEKPYKCSYCKKCFASNSTYNKHIRIHTKEKPFECSFCGMTFSQKDTMNRHEKIHFHQTAT